MKIAVKKLSPDAILPVYGSRLAAGADLCVLPGTEADIAPGETVLLPTGLALEIPEGYVGLVYARSGLATKQGLAPANKVGVIDADYRGELRVSLYNQSREVRHVSGGDRVAQLVIAPVTQGEFVEADTLSDTVRGEGGFGSTGKNILELQ